MNKLTLLATMLAMVLASAVPAFAQSVTFEGDGDDFSQGDDATNQVVESSQFTVAEFGDQTATIEQNVNGDNNETGAAIGQSQVQYSDQTIQNALADYGSLAVNFNDLDFDGMDDDIEIFFFDDIDLDGVDDDFDFIILFGDFDNDGVEDVVENAAAAAAASAAASDGSAAAAASAAAASS